MAELPFTQMQNGWKFLTKWINHPDPMTDHDWDAVINEAGDIWEASGRDKLVGDVLTAYMREIERRTE